MKVEGADYDIHLVWNIKELINKVGPEKAIRELKKRCEAGAIIGCTLYKRQIEHWLQVAMGFEDRAGRGPAEQFMAAAGEDEWVQKVERLHEEFPNGIPRSKQLDLIDEFNTNLERKVGRRIPLEPGDASEEDIKESKRIAGQMARHEKVTPPKKEKETPPAPPKEKEKPRPEPVRAAPEEPIIPVPEKPGMEAPNLDLMKQEIEERIARMRAEKARGELKAGEGKEFDDTPPPEDINSWARWALIVDYIQKHGVKNWIEFEYANHLKGATVEQLKTLSNIISDSNDLLESEKVLIKEKIAQRIKPPLRGKDFSKMSYEEIHYFVQTGQDVGNLKKLYFQIDTLSGIKNQDRKLLKEEISVRIQRILDAEELAKPGIEGGIQEARELPKEERIKLAKQIAATYPKREVEGEKTLNLDNITELPIEKRIELARKIASGEIEVREGVDILTEPKDYSQWTFGDFEGLLPGIDSVEELEEMYEQVGASGVISDNDKETLRNMIRTRIDEMKRFYTEWARG